MRRPLTTLPTLVALAVALAALAALTACEDETTPYPLRFSVAADGTPVEGAVITVAGEARGETGPDGILFLEIEGQEGTSLAVELECPAGFEAATTQRPVTLRRVKDLESDTARAVRRDLRCDPVVRHASLLVLTNADMDLPVLVDGREVARTGEAGVVHVAVDAPPGLRFEVALDTASAPDLHPRNPSQSFTLGESEELVVFSPFLDREERSPRTRRRTRRAQPEPTTHRPVRLTGRRR